MALLAVIAVLLYINLDHNTTNENSSEDQGGINFPFESTPSRTATPSPSPSVSPSPSAKSPWNSNFPFALPFDMSSLTAKAPVFSFTNCSEKVPNSSIWIPCEAMVNPTPFSALGNYTQTYFTIADMTSFNAQIFSNSDGLFGSSQTEVITWTQSFYESAYSYSVVHATWAFMTVTLPDYTTIALDDGFIHELSRLAELLQGVYDYDTIESEFIGRYGTHFPFSASYGGSINYVSYLMNCISLMYSKAWVEQQTQAVFDIMVDGTSTTTVSAYMYNELYQSSSILVKGGDSIAEVTPQSVLTWLETLGDNPEYLGFGGEWIKLSEIIPDRFGNLAAMIGQAIDQYMAANVPAQPQMVKQAFPYIPPLDFGIVHGKPQCIGSCTNTCLGQNACPSDPNGNAQLCVYEPTFYVAKISHANCGMDDDDSGHQDNCIRNLQAQGLCALPSEDDTRVCWAPYSYAGVEIQSCASANTCYPA